MCKYPATVPREEEDGELGPSEFTCGLKLDHTPLLAAFPSLPYVLLFSGCFLGSPAKYIFTPKSLSQDEHLDKPK